MNTATIMNTTLMVWPDIVKYPVAWEGRSVLRCLKISYSVPSQESSLCISGWVWIPVTLVFLPKYIYFLAILPLDNPQVEHRKYTPIQENLFARHNVTNT